MLSVLLDAHLMLNSAGRDGRLQRQLSRGVPTPCQGTVSCNRHTDETTPWTRCLTATIYPQASVAKPEWWRKTALFSHAGLPYRFLVALGVMLVWP